MIVRQGPRFFGSMLLAGSFCLSLFLGGCKHTPATLMASAPLASEQSDTVKQAGDPYGLPPELYLVEEYRVRRNQTLSDLLHPLGLSMQEIHAVSLLPDSLINERKIKQGNRYRYCTLADPGRKDPGLCPQDARRNRA